MHRIATTALVVALGMFAVACDDDDNPVGPSNTIRFTSQLLPGNEVPPVVNPNAEAGSSGTVTITLNLTRDGAQNITAATADFTASVTGLPNTTVITAAHIHPGAAGVNGSVLIGMPFSAGEFVLTNGAGSLTRTGVAVNATDAQSIINNPGGFYFNIHSALNGGGFVRGQLVRQ